MDWFTGLIDKLMRRLVILFTGFILVWVFFMVITRSVFSYTPSFGEELARYAFVWIVFLSLPIVAKSGGHMAVEFVTARVKGRTGKFLTILADSFTIAFLGIMVVEGMRMVIQMSYQLSPALQISMSWIYIALPIGCLAMLCNTLGHLVAVIRAPADERKGEAA